MAEADRRLAVVATGQLGSFTREQAHAAGLTDDQLRSRVQSGFLHRVGPHTFRWPGTRSATADINAFLLDIGGDVRAFGVSSAALLRLDGYVLRPPFHAVIGRGRNVRRAGHVIHTAVSMPLIDRAQVDGIPVTSAARTLIDLARTEPPERLAIALDSALRDGLVSESLVHRRLVALRASGRGGVERLLGVLEGAEIVRGGHSWLEREFLRLVASRRLPRPACQQTLARAGDRLVRVDCRFPGTPVVVELLGYRYHATAERLAVDAGRINALLAAGLQPYQFTYDQVVGTPDAVLDAVAAALVRAHAAA